MKSIAFISFILSIFDNPINTNDKWLSYKQQFNKTYSSKFEEIHRFIKFTANDREIEIHNEKFLKKEVPYQMGHNEFSDMSFEEFASIYLPPMKIPEIRSSFQTSHRSSVNVPDSLSYKDDCLPIQNQKNCGSCWAFASCAQVETQLKRKDKSFDTYISPQYIIDCGDAGSCQGGQAGKALEFLKEDGLVSLESYPYEAENGQCESDVEKMPEKVKSTGSKMLNGDEDELKELLAEVGPIVVLIEATNNLQNYHGGVFSDDSCPNQCDKINHAVLAVGYGHDEDSGEDYWLIRNSWGTSWGEDGYFRMIRGENSCNVGCFSYYTDV